MISTIVSRLVILVFGTLYPAYASYKAVRTKNVKEYVKWMMYWIVFALFTCIETFTDVFFSFWFPFYYEFKIVLVVYLLSPATKGSSILYRKFVHPMLSKREQEIDEYISRAKEQGYHTVLHLGSKGVTYATNVIMQTAIKGGGGIVNHLRRSYSLSDLSSDADLMADVNRNSKSLRDDGMDTEDCPREMRQRVARKATGSHVDLYFPEMDVDLRSRSHTSRELPISLSQIRSSEDISSGYSSADPLYNGDIVQGTVGESAAPLVRTASVGATRARARGGRVSVRKVPVTAEGTDSEDDFLTEDYRSRPSHSPYITNHPVFALYPELFSVFPKNFPDFLSPEIVEILLLKKIHSQNIQIQEEPIYNVGSNSSCMFENGKTCTDTEKGEEEMKGAYEINDLSENSNLVEEKTSDNKNFSTSIQSETESVDNETIFACPSEIKSIKILENFPNDKTGLNNKVYPVGVHHVVDDTVIVSDTNNDKNNEILVKTNDTETVEIKENKDSVSNCLEINNFEGKIAPTAENVKNDNSLLVLNTKSDNVFSLKEIIYESDDDDVFLDIEPEMVQEPTECVSKLTSNNKNANCISYKVEQNDPECKKLIESCETTHTSVTTNKPHIEVHNEPYLKTDNSKVRDINSMESDSNDNVGKVHNLEVSDIESVGSLTDDSVQIDDNICTTSENNRTEKSKRKGKYGKLKAPLPPSDSGKDENILLPTKKPNFSLFCQPKDMSEVSSKEENCMNAKTSVGTPDLISQLGGKSKPTSEKLKFDFFNEKKVSSQVSNFDVSKKSDLQHNIETMQESDLESVSSLVFKEDKKKDDSNKSKQKPESSGMSRFFPRNNVPSLFGMFSQKDDGTNKVVAKKSTVDQMENVLVLPEENVVVQCKEKLQLNKSTESSVRNSVEKDVEGRQETNKIVKIREMSQSPSFRKKHYEYK